MTPRRITRHRGRSRPIIAFLVGIARRSSFSPSSHPRRFHESRIPAGSWPRWRGGASGADVLLLAEATGRTIEGLVRAGLAEPERPTWKDWAGPIGLASLSAKEAEKRVVAAALSARWLPKGWTAAEEVAVAEAGAMACWRAVPCR